MKKTTKILCFISMFVLFLLCYSFYKWYGLKNDYISLQLEMKRNYAYSQTSILTPFDYMVLSEDGEKAYSYCNGMNYDHTFQTGNEDSVVYLRDYLLYCYIFAIRDNNNDAAYEFSLYYLNALDNGKMILDTALLRVTTGFLNRVLSDTSSNASNCNKWGAAFFLQKIYNGTYVEDNKDSFLYKRYGDSAAKYEYLN